ncbi:VOC family protein [Viridibacillus sp. YIM B01967]|uniref:VOC family protein n=1 Tax=Viridibacillus soli TaxID=2798301 RepID=A0ABS1H4W6_9BACL|nr:VOC family protein [Viridibacillus soli]MBK3494450.1 VOC family protein [Viridibacillus soli]
MVQRIDDKQGKFVLDEATQVGSVILKVKDLERQIEFYENVVGLELLEKNTQQAKFGGKGSRKVIFELEKTAEKLQPTKSTGLFHTAFLLPSREAFATKFFEILRNKETINSPIEQESRFPHFERFIPIARLDSASDHGYSEAFYLYDIEGNGIEIYADRDRGDWDKYPGGSNPLNFKELAPLADFDTDGKLPTETIIGHVHLRVANIEESVDFYINTLGFEEQEIIDTAFFISAGGYHHHLAGNVWSGEGLQKAAENESGLKEVRLKIPTTELFETAKNYIKQQIQIQDLGTEFAVEDPSGNRIVFEIA